METETLLSQLEFKADAQGLGTDDEGWKHNLWRVTLTFQGRTYSTDYRMGTGLVDYKPISHTRAMSARNKGEDVEWNHRFAPNKVQDALVTPRAPTLTDVLDSLSSDCTLGDQLFEDFCDDLGYDSDSIKAHKSWEACQIAYYELRRFFGARFQEFLQTCWEEQ